jgi:hypothetical protein
MSHTLDDSTIATHPGGIPLDGGKLKRFHPELYSRLKWAKRENVFSFRAFLDGGSMIKLRFEEHLMEGDARAAVVVRTAPLLVAAYSSDIDCVVMLHFDDSFVRDYSLKAGTRLLTVNLYASLRRNQYRDDLHPGAGSSEQFGAVSPLIADFLTSDTHSLKAAKAGIAEQEWQRALQLGEDYVARHGFFARDGAPLRAGSPATAREAKAGHSDGCRPLVKGPRLVVRTGQRRVEAQGYDALKGLLARGEVLPEHVVLHPVTREWIPISELTELKR